ncbi:hypothetical protein BgiMline_015138, partial [Biomphalaria glabrata]
TDCISIVVPVTVPLCLLLMTSIIVNIILYKRLKSKKRRKVNVYNTPNENLKDIHQYC